jgi:hypothetical protein
MIQTSNDAMMLHLRTLPHPRTALIARMRNHVEPNVAHKTVLCAKLVCTRMSAK